MRGRPIKYEMTVDNVIEAIGMYRDKEQSLKTIAEHFGATPYIIKQVLVAAGVDIRPRGRPAVSDVVQLDLEDYLKELDDES